MKARKANDRIFYYMHPNDIKPVTILTDRLLSGIGVLTFGGVMKKLLVTMLILFMCGSAWAYTDSQIADAIYLAEGGAKTNHPYGILAKYKHTTPRQACLNTIAHARRDWNGEGDFVSFLGSRYCPVGAANDPTGLNKNWIGNVNSILERGE